MFSYICVCLGAKFLWIHRHDTHVLRMGALSIACKVWLCCVTLLHTLGTCLHRDETTVSWRRCVRAPHAIQKSRTFRNNLTLTMCARTNWIFILGHMNLFGARLALSLIRKCMKRWLVRPHRTGKMPMSIKIEIIHVMTWTGYWVRRQRHTTANSHKIQFCCCCGFFFLNWNKSFAQSNRPHWTTHSAWFW